MESFHIEAFFYLLLAGTLQGILALLFAPVFFVIAHRFTTVSLGRLIGAYVLFQVFLLVWGCFGHQLFMSMTFDRLYVSADRLVDWMPFVPFGQWVLNQSLGDLRGHLIGNASLTQLRLIWLAVAAPVWVLTFFSTRFTMRSMTPAQLHL